MSQHAAIRDRHSMVEIRTHKCWDLLRNPWNASREFREVNRALLLLNSMVVAVQKAIRGPGPRRAKGNILARRSWFSRVFDHFLRGSQIYRCNLGGVTWGRTKAREQAIGENVCYHTKSQNPTLKWTTSTSSAKRRSIPLEWRWNQIMVCQSGVTKQVSRSPGMEKTIIIFFPSWRNSTWQEVEHHYPDLVRSVHDTKCRKEHV